VASYAGEQNLSGGTGVGIVSVNGNYAPSSFSVLGTGGPSGLLNGNAAALGGISVQLGGYNTATLLMRGQQAYAEAANLKGRLNFPGTNLAGINAGSVITIVDSNPDKTIGTPNYRPTMDATDVWVGVDNSGSRLSSALAFGSPVSVSHYINSLPDGSSWKERLTSALKSFTVPVQSPVFNATTGFQLSGSYGASGQCLISTGSASSWGACSGGASSPLTTKGDLFGFGSANVRIPVGADGQCLVADSTNAVGMKWGSCGTGTAGGALDSAVVHNTGTETVGGDKTFTGNVTVQGAMLVAGSWQVESTGPTTAMTVGAGDSKVGFDSDGKLKVSENGAAVTEVAKMNSSISGNAATATSLASAPTKCSGGQAATGVDASGNAQGCFTPSGGGTSSPLTTKGDLWVYSTVDSRMAVGANRSCLVANSSNGSGMVWVPCGTGSSTTKTTGYTLTAADDKLLFIFTGSNVTATLPAAIPSGSAVSAWSVTIENTNATPLTVSPNGLTLDGSAASLTLSQYQSATIYTDGTNYFSQRGMGAPAGVDVNGSGQVTATHLASALPVAQGGTGFTDTTYQGNTHKVATASGSFTSGNLRASDTNGNEVDAGSALIATNMPFLPFNGYNTASTPNTPFSISANVGGLYGFIIPYTITTSKFAYRVNTADPGSANYAVGIYNPSGTLLLSYSAPATTFAATTGIKTGTWTVNSGTTTLSPGKYYVMFTSGCTSSCANFTVSGSTAATFYSNSAFAIATGGTLPATISAPTGFLESFGAQVLSMVFEP
jgi:hypothetical protein